MADDRFTTAGPSDAAPEQADDAAPGSTGALRAELEARAREAAEAQDRYLRTLAEFDNYRKRTAREREDWRRQAQTDLLREILPALDNFERALAAPPGPGDAGLRTGVELIHRDFLAALERLGVRPFVAIGQTFDPQRHEAVGRVERSDVADQTVVGEPQRGYLYQDRVLRPAQVVVAMHPPGAGDPD